MLKRTLRWLFYFLLLFSLALVLMLWAWYSGGDRFEDRTTAPLLAGGADLAFTLDQPPGNIAVSPQGRIFLTIHPESSPTDLKVVEMVEGIPQPFPDQAAQHALFQAPLGIRIDRQGRIWTIDHAQHGLGQPRLLAFDLTTRQVVHRFDFPPEIAPLGSYLQDLVIDPEGKTVYIADVSFLRREPALIVYDIPSQKARRVLNKDASVMPQNYMIHTRSGPFVRLAGLIAMKVGVDGIALDEKGEWLYYGAMNHGELFRIRTADLKDPNLKEIDFTLRKEIVGRKVLSDGIILDQKSNVYLTDIEHGGIARLSPEGKLHTLLRDERIRWPDGFAWGPEGWLYFTDSALPEIAMRSKRRIREAGPYYVFRIRPGDAGGAGE